MINAQPAPLRFPQDILRFLYWVFFKPITLHNYISEIDSSLSRNDDQSLFILWRRRKEHPELVPVIYLGLFHVVFMSLLFFPLAWLFHILGFEVNWSKMAISVAGGVVLGAQSIMVFDVAIGVAVSVGVGVAGGMALSVGVGVGVAGGMAVGVAFGMAFGMALSIVIVEAFGGMVGRTIGVVLGVVLGMAVGVDFSMAGGVASSVAFIFGYFRLPLYIIQAPWSFINNRFYRGKGLAGSPILWDELIWFPLPGLNDLLVKIAKQDRQQGMEAIAFVAASFRQGWAAKRALLELTAYDVGAARDLHSISEISHNLSWLSNNARMDMHDLLLGLEQSSQHARAARESETLYNKQEQLRMGLSVVDRIRGGLALAQNSNMARQMIPALEGWKTVFTEELSKASGKEQIPNVYHAGSPLIKETKTFKGRRDLFQTLTNELINPSGQRSALLLFGGRRMGKSSTLKQLPVQLGPQIIPATVDLQGVGTVENAASLLYLIAREITRSARQERRLTLPELRREQMDKEPYLAFQEWLENVEKALGDYYWVLLALDEFETLGNMLTAGRIDERLFQTLRGVIQHHPRITILVSGAHTFEELPPLWSNYFINMKMLKVGPLEEADARKLITAPIEHFPLIYDEEAVSLLLRETGCHPNWLQCACREVVENLNNENRFHANLRDVESALNKVPESLAGDFKDLWEGRDSDDDKCTVLKAIAQSEDGLTEATILKQFSGMNGVMNFFTKRDILVVENGLYHFRSELLRKWVAKQA
jgi:hypothetical protein